MLPEFFTPQKLDANFACTSTTGSCMHKWMPQAHSAHQIGPETILQGVLIVVESGGRGGRINAAGIFHFSEIGRRFCLYLNNRQSHAQMDATGRFSASNWSKNNPPRCCNCRLLMLYKVVKELWVEFFALRLWRCSGQPCNNQQNYGQMDVRAEFSGSERSRNNLGRNSNCSRRMFYSRENLWIRWPIGLDQNTLPPMAPVFLYISSKLPREILEQLCVYCKNLLGLCVRKCGNREVQWLWWFKLRSGMRITALQSID